MNDKHRVLTALREVFNQWEAMLASLNEAQINAPTQPATLSIKDIIGHLRAWQQITIARMEAARLNRDPEFPEWLAGLDPEAEDNTDDYNDRIHHIYRDQPWSSVYQVWRDGFLHLLDLVAALPEQDLLEKGKYHWLPNNPLSAVLEGTYEHHQEHLDEVRQPIQS